MFFIQSLTVENNIHISDYTLTSYENKCLLFKNILLLSFIFIIFH